MHSLKMKTYSLVLLLAVFAAYSGIVNAEGVSVPYKGKSGSYTTKSIDAAPGIVYVFSIDNQSGKDIGWKWTGHSGAGEWSGTGDNLQFTPTKSASQGNYSVTAKVWIKGDGEGGSAHTVQGDGKVIPPIVKVTAPKNDEYVAKGSSTSVSIKASLSGEHNWSGELVEISAGDYSAQKNTNPSGIASHVFTPGDWDVDEYTTKAKVVSLPTITGEGKKIIVVGVDNISADPDPGYIHKDVTFTATTIPAGHEDLVTWSGGGTPATGEGGTFTTQWSTKGNKTVIALDKNFEITINCTLLTCYYQVEACSNLEQHPTKAKVTDGCSYSLENPSRWLPTPCAECVNTSFTGPCDSHDKCYQTCQTGDINKATCDANFADAMADGVCDALIGEERQLCYGRCVFHSITYSTSVVICGDLIYEGRQIEYCVCCD